MSPHPAANHNSSSQHTHSITVFDYNETQLTKTTPTDLRAYGATKKKANTVTWIDIDSSRASTLIEDIGKIFELHPLILDDLHQGQQRPKAEDYDDCIYLVLTMIRYDRTRQTMVPEKISLILFPHLLLSYQEGRAGDVLDPIRTRLENNQHRLRRLGSDYLMYSIIDAVTDHYFVALESFGEKIEGLEESLVKNPDPATLNALRRLKREIIYLRKSAWPMREVIGFLERADSRLIKASTAVYLRDAYNHAVQIIDTIETYRDMISGMLDIYLSSSSNRLNEVMKVLTIISTIFIPLTFIVGLYGMNFRYMPELAWPLGYPLVLAIMLVITLGMIYFFRKKRWF
ncbi:magnesium/cobalt transporter CorA [Candidatus Falkowbacteria bacterium]|nr:magnesium/cobalt transporter CorA [Candidatus Falkowbacteria bacterium]